MLRIRSAQPLEDLKVRMTLTDGQIVERDLRPLLVGSVFESLVQDPDRFRQMVVLDGTLTWPGNIDLDPDMVIWGGPPPVEQRQEAS